MNGMLAYAAAALAGIAGREPPEATEELIAADSTRR